MTEPWRSNLLRYIQRRQQKQRACLLQYVQTLHAKDAANRDAFPLDRHTGTDAWAQVSGLQEIRTRFEASHIRPFMGVVAAETRDATWNDRLLLRYPGFVMTKAEYDSMPHHVPTAVSADAVSELHDLQVVGDPTEVGPNVMCNYGYTQAPWRVEPNAQLFQLERSEYDLLPSLHAGGKPRLPDHVCHIRQHAHSGIQAGDELIVDVYSEDFFADDPSCEECCLKLPMAASRMVCGCRTLVAHRHCAAPGCSVVFHDNGRCTQAAHANADGTLVCIPHKLVPVTPDDLRRIQAHRVQRTSNPGRVDVPDTAVRRLASMLDAWLEDLRLDMQWDTRVVSTVAVWLKRSELAGVQPSQLLEFSRQFGASLHWRLVDLHADTHGLYCLYLSVNTGHWQRSDPHATAFYNLDARRIRIVRGNQADFWAHVLPRVTGALLLAQIQRHPSARSGLLPIYSALNVRVGESAPDAPRHIPGGLALHPRDWIEASAL